MEEARRLESGQKARGFGRVFLEQEGVVDGLERDDGDFAAVDYGVMGGVYGAVGHGWFGGNLSGSSLSMGVLLRLRSG